MKRKMTALLTVVLMLAMLAGCGNSSQTTANENETETESTSSEAEKVEEVEEVKEEETTEPVEVKTMSVYSMLERLLSDSDENEVTPQCVVLYIAKMPKENDNGVDETTQFEMVKYMGNYFPTVTGYIADYTTENIDGNVSYIADESTKRYTVTLGEVDLNTQRLFSDMKYDLSCYGRSKFSLQTSETGETLGEIFGVERTVDETGNESSGYMLDTVIYFGRDIERIQMNGKSFVLFRAVVTETDGEYVYYTAIEDDAETTDSEIVLDEVGNDYGIFENAIVIDSVIQ